MKLKYLIPFPLLVPWEKGLWRELARDLVGWAVCGLNPLGKLSRVILLNKQTKKITTSPLEFLFTLKPETILTANRS